MTFSGRWSGEFAQQLLPFAVGAIVRENRRGRTSHDCFPGMIAMGPGCCEESGLAWGFHLGASGNHQMRAERFSDGRALFSASELLLPGEIMLGDERKSYRTPTLYACVSSLGLAGVSRAFQSFVRTSILPPTAKAKPRPVHYNTWEAVYFNHDQSTLSDLASRAADLGVERFVLDDGWFGGRRHDRAGLGDWTVSQGVYPDGLAPLISHVNKLGMEFGLWVEPEMVNPDSDLYRAHPDWVLQAPGVPQQDMRHQWVLDLTQQEVSDYLFTCLDGLLAAYPIAYLKWDMNRDISHPGGRNGRPVASDYVAAVHALIDRLRTAHPDVEIESCASGGGRANYEILRRTDRIWTSDSNDALDRLVIQRGCGLFFPPEVMGSHVGPRDCHVTGRRVSMDMRAGVALYGHMGLEMDLRELTPAETETLKAAIGMYKQFRPLLHDGIAVRFNQRPFEERWGVVSKDSQLGLFGYALTASLPDTVPGRFWFVGLDPASDYRLEWVWPRQADGKNAQHPDCGLSLLDGQVVSGATLMNAGVELPYMKPQSLVIISVVRA
jgi:alpha-galactosidase